MQSKLQRAKQFLPFDSLKGFYELIEKEEKQKDNKKELSEDILSNINKVMLNIKKNDNVLIKHYHNEKYIETIGKVKKIDKINKIIYLDNTKIYFDDVIDIKNMQL